MVWIGEDSKISFVKRTVMIENRFTMRDGWFNCTLCNKKAADYDSSLPHIESERHKRKLLWAAPYTEEEEENCDSDYSGKMHPIVKHLRDSSVLLNALVTAMGTPKNISVTSEELQDIHNGCGELASLVEAATKKIDCLEKIEIAAVQQTQNKLSDGRTCVLCFHRERSKYFLPCKHFVVCSECLSGLRPEICPICRENIVESHDVIAS